MTDYIPFTTDEYAPDAPATALHFERWFRNWIAGFEGAAGAPKVAGEALNLGLSSIAVPGVITGIGSRIKTLVLKIGIGGTSPSGSSTTISAQVRVSSNGGSTWSGYYTVATRIISSGTQSATIVSDVFLNLKTGVMSSMANHWEKNSTTVFPADYTFTGYTNINAIQIAGSAGIAVIHSLEGVAP